MGFGGEPVGLGGPSFRRGVGGLWICSSSLVRMHFEELFGIEGVGFLRRARKVR